MEETLAWAEVANISTSQGLAFYCRPSLFFVCEDNEPKRVCSGGAKATADAACVSCLTDDGWSRQ